MSRFKFTRVSRHASTLSLVLFASLVASACGDSSQTPQPKPNTTGSTSPSGTPGSTNGTAPGCTLGQPGTQLCAPQVEVLDQSTCKALNTDFTPGSTTDPFGACSVDTGKYVLADKPPSSIGRITAYETVATALWKRGRPCPADFAAARAAYEQAEGLGSRVGRREDLHYPPVPVAEHKPGVDPDKQCRDAEIAARHPDRCAGPARIAPLISASFVEGINGTNPNPNLLAARIKGALAWFMYLSVYKEAHTCFSVKQADCDSSWAYYTGGELDPNGAMLGLAQMVKELSVPAHQAIVNGILAVRCVRDLYPAATYPKIDTLPPEGKQLFDQAFEQLDNALHRGYMVLIRQHLQAGATCSKEYAANWAFLQVAGPILDREAIQRNPTLGNQLAALWKSPTADANIMAKAASLLDQIFPCSAPQG